MFFDNITDLKELKMQYKILIFQWHPDRNHSPEATRMTQEINAEYDRRIKGFQADDDREKFSDILNVLLKESDAIVELCGEWLWVQIPKEKKDIVKGLGFRWSHNKQLWYYHEGTYRRSGKKKYTMEDIRDRHGSKVFRQGQKTIAG